MELDVEVDEVLIVFRGRLRLLQALAQLLQICRTAPLRGPHGDGAVIVETVFTQLLQRDLVELDHLGQRLLHAVQARLLHHGAGGAVRRSDIASLLEHAQRLADGRAAAVELRHHGALGGETVSGLELSGENKFPQLKINFLTGAARFDRLPGDLYCVVVHKDGPSLNKITYVYYAKNGALSQGGRGEKRC